jgi:Flp pilus assembly protein TadG
MKKMRGVAMVEFAIIASLLLMLLFACLEFGLVTYTYAALNEGTRRAARLAAVCPINDPVITTAVNFTGVSGFNSSMVSVNYLDASGNSLGAAPALSSVYYVQVGLKTGGAGYTMPLAIPFVNSMLTAPSFTVTLPAESLGLSNTGVSTAC